MKMDRFFVVVGRVNSILFLCILLAAAVGIGFSFASSSRFQERGTVQVAAGPTGTKAPVLLNFGTAESIAGANALMIPLTTQEKGGKFSSGASGNETRNLLFVTGTAQGGHWLFNEHSYNILVAVQLKDSPLKPDQPTSAIYVEYVPTDTDGDAKLSESDASIIGLAKPDGTGLVTVLKDVSRVFSYEMVDAGHLSIVFQRDRKIRHATITLPDFKLVSDREVVNVPDAV